MATNAVIGALRVNLGIDTAAFQDGLRDVQKSLGKVGKRLQRTGQDLSLRVSAPLAAIGGLSLKAFSDFEKGLIGVGKTTDIAGADLRALGDSIAEIGARVPVATDELLGIAQAAGQLGVKGSENITRFAETVAKLGISSNLAGDEAATALARILTVTGTSIADVDRLGSTIVRLGNNFAATESEIAEASTRVAQATSQFGVAASEVAGIGAALTAVGVRAEAGGTVIGRAFQSINDAVRQGGEQMQAFTEITGRSAEELSQLFADDPTQAFQALVEGLGRINAEGGDVTAAMEAMGLSGVRVVQVLGTLATRSDVLGDALSQANTEWRENAALNREAAIATESFASQTRLARNALNEASRALGSAIAPAARTLINLLADIALSLSEVNPSILRFGVVIGGLAAIIGPALVVIGLLATGIAAVGLPIAGVIAGIGLLAAGIIAFWEDIEPVVTAIADGFKHLWQGIINDIERVERAFRRVGEVVRSTLEKMGADVDAALGEKGMFRTVGRLGKWSEAVKAIFSDLANKVVGNSIVPDMVDDIVAEFGRLGRGMQASTEQATGQVSQSFSGMSQSVSSELKGVLDGSKSWSDALVSVMERMRDRLFDRVFEPIEDALAGLFSGAGGSGGGGIFGAIGSAISGLLGGGGTGGFTGTGVGRVPVGFAHGGSFTVGGAAGIDRNLVQFRASRGERVDITPAGKSGGGGANVHVEVINNTGAPVSEDRQQTIDGERVRIVIGEMMAGEAQRPGSALNSVLSRMGARTPLTRR